MARRGMPLAAAIVVSVVVAAATLAVAYRASPPSSASEVPDGDPSRGIDLMREAGCGSCHTIPGVDGANAWVGPPLTHWRERELIAGQLPNTGANLVRWIQDPRAVEPGTAMPDTGLSAQQARDVAAYLFTLG